MSKKYDNNLNEIKDTLAIKTFASNTSSTADYIGNEFDQLKQQLADTEAQNKRVLEKLELLVKDNQDLQQQLAEKDKECEKLKAISEGVKTLKESGCKIEDFVMIDTKQIRNQICEEIRDAIEDTIEKANGENGYQNDGNLYLYYGFDDIKKFDFDKIIDQIEKGE